MAIRRRVRRITNVVGDVDRRVRNLELNRYIVGSSTAGNTTDSAEAENIVYPSGTQISASAPNAWVPIRAGYFYPPAVTGRTSRTELFFNSTPPVAVGEVSFSSGTSTGGGDGVRTIIAVTPDRNSYRTGYPLPAGTTSSVIFSSQNLSKSNTISTLVTKGDVNKLSATTTTATITFFSSSHPFEVGDTIYVNELPAAYPQFRNGIGVAVVASRNDANKAITFDFLTPLSAAISEQTYTSGSYYVYGALQKYVAVGDSWIDDTTDPDTVYVWSGLRWVMTGDPASSQYIKNDGIAPAPPTSVSSTTTGYVASGSAQSSITLSWTAPTTNSDGSALKDFAGYTIAWKYSNTSYQELVFGPETTQTLLGFRQNAVISFQIYARDLFGLRSTPVAYNTTTGTASLAVNPPSAPSVSTRFGTVTVDWDGLDNISGTQSPLLDYVEVHYSTTSGFTPSTATLAGRIRTKGDSVTITDLTYNTAYYFKLRSVDVSGNATAGSAQAVATVKPLVDADLLAAKLNAPLSQWPFANAAVTPGALASGVINASNIFGPNVIVQEAIAANAIGTNQLAANAITAGKILAGEISANLIAANAITAAKIEANAVTADKILAGSINASKLTADAIDGKTITGVTITGGTFKTAASGARLELSSSAYQYIKVYDTNGTDVVSTIYTYGTSASGGMSLSVAGASAILESSSLKLTSGGNILLNNFATDKNIQINPPSGYQAIIAGGLSVNSGSVNITTGYLDVSGSYIRCLDTYGRSHTAGTDRALYVNSAGAYGTRASSRRFKQQIKPLSLYIDISKILQVTPVTYKYNEQVDLLGDSANISVGFIAEELDDLGLKEWVSYDDDDRTIPHSVDYSYFVVALQEVVRAQHGLIEDLTKRVEDLEAK